MKLCHIEVLVVMYELLLVRFVKITVTHTIVFNLVVYSWDTALTVLT